MGTQKLIKTVKSEAYSFNIHEISGYPHNVTENNIFIQPNKIIISSIEPIRLSLRGSDQGKPLVEARYHSKPLIVVFYSNNAPSIKKDLMLFGNKYKEKLNCDYVVGTFNNVSSVLIDGTVLMEKDKCFCVALFNLNLGKTLDFVTSYIHETNRTGALVIGLRPVYSNLVIEKIDISNKEEQLCLEQ